MTTLSEQFRDFWIRNGFPSRGGKILVAVSGGIDSVVMTHLLHESGFSCAVVHCNFQLRGEDSDADEQFVKQLASQYHFTFFSTRFETKSFASDNSVSIQMAARQLRYQWFDELVEKYSFDAVAVAHHADDVAETMLINLVRGTGLAGMHGIRVKNNNIIRPILFASRSDIESYASKHVLKWREDASNAETVYLRNKIRLEVLPLLRTINPEVSSSLVQHAGLMEGYEALLQEYISMKEGKLIRGIMNDSIKSISLEQIKASPAPAILLYHFLKPYGGNASVCREILSNSQAGAVFELTNHKLVRDREELVLMPLNFSDDREYMLSESDESICLKFGKLEMSKVDSFEFPAIKSSPEFMDGNSAFVDMSRIKFPLVVRKWQKGDYFHPLGMQGRKLLSDYFTDEKFSTFMKEMVYLLCSDNEVVWLTGHRLDNRFKLDASSKECLHLKFIPNY